MEFMTNFVTETFFFLLKKVTKPKKKEQLLLGEKKQSFMTDIQLVEIIRCITRLLITIAIVVLVIKTDLAKLGLLLGFTLFAMVIYMALRD